MAVPANTSYPYSGHKTVLLSLHHYHAPSAISISALTAIFWVNLN